MLISVEEAEARMRAAVPLGPSERVALSHAAGRILREPIRTPRALPPYTRVMMDGIAVCAQAFAAGRRSFTLLGTQHAGDAAVRLDHPEACWRVMTGAVCPLGATLVIPREHVVTEGAEARVDPPFVPPSNGYLHPSGSDAAAGTVLLKTGTPLLGAALGVVASCNCATVSVARQPRVALISTGDELKEPGSALKPHQIPRSNVYALAALLRNHLKVELESHHCMDERRALESGLASALEWADVVVCSGGVSMGDRDFLPSVLAALGVEECFHGVAQRPGKPFWFGRRGDGTLVFGLPGNPVSTLVGGRRYLVEALRQWAGAVAAPPLRIPLAKAFSFRPPLTCFLPVRNLGASLEPAPVRNSGDFTHLLGSDGFVALPAPVDVFPVGYEADYFPW